MFAELRILIRILLTNVFVILRDAINISSCFGFRCFISSSLNTIGWSPFGRYLFNYGFFAYIFRAEEQLSLADGSLTITFTCHSIRPQGFRGTRIRLRNLLRCPFRTRFQFAPQGIVIFSVMSMVLIKVVVFGHISHCQRDP